MLMLRLTCRVCLRCHHHVLAHTTATSTKAWCFVDPCTCNNFTEVEVIIDKKHKVFSTSTREKVRT